ncbi:MAG: sterol-binding protein [Frankiales bacterium]|nr:sterol-binding protein [Frankiales bacterium]
MADVEDVRAALDQVVATLDDVDDATRARIPDIAVAALVRDHSLAVAADLRGGRLTDVRDVDLVAFRAARLRLTMDSDVLLDLVEGRLSFGRAWARGRVKVDAHLRDLFLLRSFL